VRDVYYILFYETVEDYVERRAPYREEHLAYARAAQERGSLVMAGAFSEPADGAVLIFKGEAPAIAEEFARDDPYVINGLITKWHVRQWAVAIGGE
jgi:uncharacterized protein YciI